MRRQRALHLRSTETAPSRWSETKLPDCLLRKTNTKTYEMRIWRNMTKIWRPQKWKREREKYEIALFVITTQSVSTHLLDSTDHIDRVGRCCCVHQGFVIVLKWETFQKFVISGLALLRYDVTIPREKHDAQDDGEGDADWEMLQRSMNFWENIFYLNSLTSLWSHFS